MNEHATSQRRGSCEEHIWPYRHLALRVVALALQDVANPSGSPTDRESARMFLKGSGMLFHWCRVAALDPNCIVTVAAKLGVDSEVACTIGSRTATEAS